MLPDRVSNPGPLTYESDALPIALRGPASKAAYFIILHLTAKTYEKLKQANYKGCCCCCCVVALRPR